ncbi:MAG: hypothetical protein GY798_07785 [Hyphomicrobiales bacterium]|nr:hypothetical protein [Hyphomicrobiales bacterium]
MSFSLSEGTNFGVDPTVALSKTTPLLGKIYVNVTWPPRFDIPTNSFVMIVRESHGAAIVAKLPLSMQLTGPSCAVRNGRSTFDHANQRSRGDWRRDRRPNGECDLRENLASITPLAVQKGRKQLPKVIKGIKFTDGVAVIADTETKAA